MKKRSLFFNSAVLCMVALTTIGCAGMPVSQLLSPELMRAAQKSPIMPDVVSAGWSQSPNATAENFADPGTFWVEGTWYLDKKDDQ